MDEEIRSYERALLRSGTDPRRIGAALLAADLDRFWILVRAKPRIVMPDTSPPISVTGYVRVARRLAVLEDAEEVPESLWAFRVDTISEHVELADFFAKTLTPFFLWDRKKGEQATFYGHATYCRVERGWANKQDVPLAFDQA